MDKLKPCPFCGKPLYIKIKRYTKPLLAPLTPAAALRDELIDITGEDYVPIQAVYCPICGHPLNRRATPENKPLTLEELRKMQGQPVYCIGQTRFDVHFDGWKVVTKNNSMVNVIRFTDGMDFPVDVYGKRLLAYARKPEGSEKP
jgi:endogenous inhibitor of DNA gyrase (YacG/DUF329 family)